MEQKRGFFVVIEGTDGTGKATQTELLVEKLKKEGRKVYVLDFPQYGKNAFADSVGAYLRGDYGPATEINPYLASFCYAGDRAKMSAEIKKMLDAGYVVVSNRYTSANMGHQGGKIKDKEERRKFLEWLKELEFSERGYNIPKPDTTLLLYLNPEVAQALVDRKAAREYTKGQKRDGHEGNIKHLQDTAQTFLEIAQEEPDWHVINCEDKNQNDILPREEIHNRVWDVVKNKIN